MSRISSAASSFAALAVTANAFAGQVSVFLGEAGKAGDVKVFGTQSGAPTWPAALQDVRLLPLDFGGRVELLEYQPDRPRRVADVPQAARLLLPNGAGSLYRYVRGESDGSKTFGLFLVDGSGAATSLWELSDAGSGADPWLDVLAVAPAGDALLVATALAAGGDLYELDLAAHTATCRTSALPPLDFAGSGLALGADFGVGVASTGIARFVRGSSGDASFVAFANASQPTWFGREVVLSANGLFAATIAGASSTEAHPFVFDACHDAVAVDPTPRALASAGFLPDHLAGPYLAVSDDGTRCAWSVLEASPEVYVGLVPPFGASGGVHVTHDALFHPFLDEIGLYGFLPTGKLHVGIGDRLDANLGGLTRMDVFLVGLGDDGANLAVTDLSQSSGSSYPPFNYYPTLQADRVALSPDREWTIVYSNPTGDAGLVLVVPTDGHGVVPTPAITGLDDLGFLELTDTHVLLGGERELASGDIEEIYHLAYGFFTQAAAVLPLDDEDLGALHVRSNGWAGLATPNDQDGQWLWRVDVATGAPQKFTDRNFDYGPTLWVAASGALATSLGELDQPSLFFVWPPVGPPKRLQATPAKGFVLPGA